MSVAEAIEDLRLLDHHVHTVLPGAVARADFEGYLTESDQPAPAGTTQFDSQLGFAVRRWCAPRRADLPFARHTELSRSSDHVRSKPGRAVGRGRPRAATAVPHRIRRPGPGPAPRQSGHGPPLPR